MPSPKVYKCSIGSADSNAIDFAAGCNKIVRPLNKSPNRRSMPGSNLIEKNELTKLNVVMDLNNEEGSLNNLTDSLKKDQ